MPNKCVCGADATVSVAELGDALQRAAVATICTTCFHIILKGALPAEPTLSVSAAVPPSPATGQGPGQAPSGSLDNGSTAGSANNNSTEATVEDPDVEFAPLHRQVFATRKLARDAARTVDGCFVSIPGRQNVYACSCEGCDTKRYVRHDQVAGQWTIKQIGLCEHGTNSSYLEGMSLHLPLPMTLKLKDLLQGNCPQRALALMREAFPGDPVVGKMSAKWIANWNARRPPPPPPSTKAELEKWINEPVGDNWTCGYHSLGYICLLARTEIGTDLGALVLPPMAADFIGQVQACLREAAMTSSDTVGEMLSGVTGAVASVCVNTQLWLAEMHGIPPTVHWVQVKVVGRKCQGLVPLEYARPPYAKVRAPLKHLFAAMTAQMQRICGKTQNEPPVPCPSPRTQPIHSLPWSMLLPQSQNPARALPLPWSMALHKFQNPAHPPPLRCTVHQSSQCLRICIAKPQRATKCVQCSLTTCVQGTRVICIGVRCSRWRALSSQSSGRLIRNPVLIPLQMCFLPRQLHGLLFIAFQVLIVHQRPLCIHTPTTKLQAQKRPCAQLHR